MRHFCGAGGICGSQGPLVSLDAPFWARGSLVGLEVPLWAKVVIVGQGSLEGVRGHLWVGKILLAQQVPCGAGGTLVGLPPPLTCTTCQALLGTPSSGFCNATAGP